MIHICQAGAHIHGAIYAVTESVAKIVAAGGDYKKIRFTFQEYFRRMTEDPHRWSQPFAALLGAYDAQLGFGLPSIGGKDSMSGTFEDIDVPPTLVSFAVDVAKEKDIITPELKKAGSKLDLDLDIQRTEYDLPDYEKLMAVYEKYLTRQCIQVRLCICICIWMRHGVVPAVSKMAFGNSMGVKLSDEIPAGQLFAPAFTDIVAEVEADKIDELGFEYVEIGEVTAEPNFVYGNTVITIKEAVDAWKETLERVFKTVSGEETGSAVPEVGEEKSSDGKLGEDGLFRASKVYVCEHKIAQPTVFIPVFPGTNCEYDSAKAFERAGAKVITKVFRNMDASDIRESVDVFEKAISQSQIIMFPGGFSAGDEPDGSAKFFATAFQNAKTEGSSA